MLRNPLLTRTDMMCIGDIIRLLLLHRLLFLHRIGTLHRAGLRGTRPLTVALLRLRPLRFLKWSAPAAALPGEELQPNRRFRLGHRLLRRLGRPLPGLRVSIGVGLIAGTPLPLLLPELLQLLPPCSEEIGAVLVSATAAAAPVIHAEISGPALGQRSREAGRHQPIPPAETY
uniref:Uncharacterized protein n=1 Tax=Zea mays TaxID=4577 RepID=C4J4Y7_MAIZE|nr:unknown [Zea mays]